MNKLRQSNQPESSKTSSASFIKRGVAIVGSSGLVFGFGLTGATSAGANGAVDCTARTVTASTNPVDPTANVLAIDAMLASAGVVCLSGDFILDSLISVQRDVHFYGIGNTSVKTNPVGFVFFSDMDANGAFWDITIENLTVKDSDNGVFAKDVFIIDSTFSGITQGAVYAYGSVTVSNSTFINNTSEVNGGAITAGSDPGDSVHITNSTFQGNSAVGEGGAISASEGEVYFSTFVNNVAATPPAEPGDIPGNAIYKSGMGTFTLAGNIFAGNSFFPQLGVGVPSTTQFTDAGGNIFSTSSITETDIAQDNSSVFGATLTSLFGTNSPALATYAPNTNGTQTIALGPGSPALNAVPDLAPFNLVTLDQRGATRSFPADAGAFEGFVIPTSTPTSTTPAVLAKTGNENLFWSTLASGTLIVFGTLVAVVISRIRRRTSNL
jgi:predicted outer membrane repeat protein